MPDARYHLDVPKSTRSRPARAAARTRAADPRALARETLSREVGYVVKPHGGRLRVALAFPNTYFVGMSNLGLQTVYRLFNADDRVVCERAFLPAKQDLARQIARHEPLVTLESQTAVREFDVFAFSVSFEWDYTNVVSMLRLAGLAPRAADRDPRDPLVVIGGAVTFVNPEPLAPFADVIAAGEAERLVTPLVDAWHDERARDALLRRLAAGTGFYVPSFYEPVYDGPGRIAALTPRAETGAPAIVRKAAVKTADQLDPPVTGIFTPDTEFGARLLIEVVRGCANLCRFCWAGYNYLPVRAFPADRVLALAEAARPHATRVGLVSIALCDHPEIERILRALIDMGYGISPASLRLDDLTDPIVAMLRESGERSITIAPETGSDRLRRVINKTVTNDEILDRADLIFRNGIENLKLYYMLGLPTETDDDLQAIARLTTEIRDRMLAHGRSRGALGRIVASVNPLVPKPGTTFQWLPMTPAREIDAKVARLRALVAGLDNVYFNIKSERHSYYQGLLSLGDRRVADVIERAEANGGQWRAAVAEAGLDADAYLYRDRTQDGFLPWQIIDGPARHGFFQAEFDRSLREEWTLPPKRARENASLVRTLAPDA
ncbi:MAG: radical SAM protein [Vicinamibacterales bacterium]